MAALMIMSCWVFFAPEAEAVTAGSYNYEIKIVMSDGADGWDNGDLTLYGKNNNGKGAEAQITKKSGLYVNQDSGTYDWLSGSSASFPTRITYYYKFGGGFTWRSMAGKLQLYVNGTLVGEQSFSGNSKAFSAASGTVTLTVASGNYPKANAVVFDANPGNISAPGSNSSAHYHLNDQYGVRVSSSNSSPSVSVSSNKTIANGSLTVSNNNNNNAYSVATIKATEGIKQTDVDSQTGTLNVSYNFNGVPKSSSKTFTIYDPQYTFSFNGNGGTISPSAAVKKYYYNEINANEIPSSGTKTGYEFIGMYTSAKTSYDLTKPTAGTTSGYTGNLTGGTKIDADRTYYAAWWAKNVKVTFVDNMGTVIAETTLGKYDKTFANSNSGLTLPADVPFKSNDETGTFKYDFNGHWKVINAKQYNADGTQSEYQGQYGTDSGSFILKGDTVFQAQYEKTAESYNVKFYNEDGNVKQEKNDYKYRDVASTDPLTKAEDNYFNYTFKGWHKVEYQTDNKGNKLKDASGNYIPVAGEQKTAYIVNKDGYLSTSEESDAADAGNRYISVAGDDDFIVRSDAEFVPVFEKTYNEYTVTLKYKTATGEEVTFNNDGKTYHFGDALELPTVPESYTTAGYRYPLNGYTKNGASTGSTALPATLDTSVTTSATKTVNYVATYGKGIPAKYTISFTYKDSDGTDKTVTNENVSHDSAVTAPTVPQTYRDSENEYTFSKWLDQDGAGFKSPAYKDAQYVAQYTAKKLYTVTFMNEGEEFGTKAQYVAGSPIVRPSEIPTKPADKTAYEYTFKNWVDESGNEVTTMPENDLVLEASYTPSFIDYVIEFVWKDKNGADVKDEKHYHYGAEITIPDLETLGQTGYKDETYSYVFKGWDTDVSKRCLGEGEMNADNTSATLTYTATYRRSYNYYKVTWMKQTSIVNGKIQYDDPYMTDAFLFNEKARIPTVPPKSVEIPENPAFSMVLDHWYYVEDGKQIEINRDTRITKDITAYPVYKQAAKTCKVSLYDSDGITPIQIVEVEYGTKLSESNAIGIPRKTFSDTEHFRFTHWADLTTDAKVDVITADCNLKAVYVQEPHNYGEIIADKDPTFFEEGHGTKYCEDCAKTLSNQSIEKIPDTVDPTAKLFIKNAVTESTKLSEISNEPLLVAPKNNLVVATVDRAEVSEYNPSARGIGTGKIEYFVSEGTEPLTSEQIDALGEGGWKTRFDYDEYVAELKKQGISDDEIAAAMSEFEANATAYVGDLANSFPSIVVDGNTFIFYAKVTDRNGNADCFVRSQPLVYDETKPDIKLSGNGNGRSKFCEEVDVIVTENVKLDSVKVNGTIQTLQLLEGEKNTEKGGTFTLSGKGFYQITVTDVAGNITETNVEILGSHTEKVTVTAPTCTAKGITSYTCSVCGKETKTAVESDALGHDFKPIDKVEKTCVDDGYTLERCSRCGLTQQTNIEKATGNHTYAGENNGWVVSKKATCSEEGSKYRVCTVCGEYQFGTVEIDPSAHVWYRGVVTKPTCTKDGYTMHTCKYCGYTEKVEGSDVDALGHEAAAEWVVVTPASCKGYDEEAKTGGTTGVKIHHCVRCDVEMNKELAEAENKPEYNTETEIPVPNHMWKQTKVVEPTTESDGYTEYTCQSCGETKTVKGAPKLVERTVTFMVEDEKYAEIKKVAGESVTVDDPTKAADKTNTYTFSHWADESGKKVDLPVEVPADKDITLTAVFEKKQINYLYIFYKATDTAPVEYVKFKQVGYVAYNEEARTVPGPSNYETDGATYEFVGWVVKDEIPILEDIIAEDGTVTAKANVSKSIKASEVEFDENNTAEFVAVFKKTVKKVNLTFAYDITSGKYIYTNEYDYGTEIKNINDVIPEDVKSTVKKDADETYHYSFKEWKVREGAESLKSLKQNTLALAVFNATAHDFKVVEGEGHYKAPTCTEDGYQDMACSCGKTFRTVTPATGHKWETTPDAEGKVVCSVCGEKKDYEATFTVTFYNENGATVKKLSDLKWKADISKFIPTDVSKASDEKNDYEFAYWYKKGDETKTKVDVETIVTKDAEYVAAFTATARKYSVIYRIAGTTTALQVTKVEYGADLPAYTGATPVNEKFDDYHHYVFVGFDKSAEDFPKGVTGDVIITAVFTPEGHDCKVIEMKNATCTEPMTETYKCAKCAYTYSSQSGKALGHKWKLVETVDPTEKDAGYELYKCERSGCKETYKKILEPKKYIYFTVTVIDQDGAPVQGATVTIFDGTKFVASGSTDAHGKVIFRVEEAKKYRVVVEYNKQHVEGDLTVNPDGSTEGGSIGVTVAHCSCTCHRDGVWPAIFRFFHKVIKMLVGHFVCCGNPDPRYGN